MNALFDAIWARFAGSPLAAILTALYNTEADDGAVYPYGVVKLPSNVPGDGEFGVDWEDFLITFTFYDDATTMTVLGDAFEALKVLFDHHDLVVAGYETITMEREPANLIRVEQVWQYDVTYRLLIEKT